jgi:hypothetical protein
MDARLQLHNPLRQPNWRALRAAYLADHLPKPVPARRQDDKRVCAYYRYLAGLYSAGDDDPLRQKIISKLPHVDRAHRLQFDAEYELRQTMEAWLLTREPIPEIAARFAMDAAVVEYFEQLFFNVRDRLDCTTWIIKTIRGGGGDAGTKDRPRLERGILLREFAYFGGALVLDALISGRLFGLSQVSAANVGSFWETLPGTRDWHAICSLKKN